MGSQERNGRGSLRRSSPTQGCRANGKIIILWTQLGQGNNNIRQCTYNATLRPVRQNTVVMEKQYVFCVLSVCL